MSMAGIAKYERAAGLFRCPVCARRAQAEEELGRIEGELKQKLMDMRG